MHCGSGQSAWSMKYEGTKETPYNSQWQKNDKIIGYVDLALKIIIYQNKMHFTSFNEILYTLLFQSIPKNMAEKWRIKLQIFPKIKHDK